ncbi:MAG TPA: hypothetical protein VFL82_03490 [Thermomicrobiales bacterium]|nr:hypothetical protein [Thermomicrobiales bacterium]
MSGAPQDHRSPRRPPRTIHPMHDPLTRWLERHGIIRLRTEPIREFADFAEAMNTLMTILLQPVNRALRRFFRAVGCPPIPPPSPTPPCPYCGNPVRLVFLRSGVCCAACGHTLTRDDLRVLGFTVLEED